MNHPPTHIRSNKQTVHSARKIAVFIPWRSEYPQRLLEGILRYQADQTGYVFRDYQFDDSGTLWTEKTGGEHYPTPWLDWQPDGLLTSIAGQDLIHLVKATRLPTVNMGSSCLGHLPSVYIDPDLLMKAAFEHLRSIDRRQIIFAGCETDYPAWIRALGRIVATDGATLSILNLAETNWNCVDWRREESLSTAADVVSILTSARKPLGVIAGHDNIGRTICLACGKLGLRVPEDVAVLGIDDTAQARSAIPPLSSIHNPGEEVGYRAATLVCKMLEGGIGLPQAIKVPPGLLMVRQSTSMPTQSDHEMSRAVQLIRGRALDGSSIESMLDELQVSRSTLERYFASTIGRSPREEIALVRVSRAKELLCNTDLSIDRIAAQVGYSKSHNFITFFRKQTGTTPAAYRKLRPQAQ